MRRALLAPVEALEKRIMLAIDVTAKVLESPLFTVGNRWTYTNTASDGTQASYVRKVIGATTFNGNDCFEIDTTAAGSTDFVSKLFYGLDSAGEYVSYGSQITGPQFQQTTVDSPYEVFLPATIAAGTSYGFSCTETQSSTNASGGVTTTTDTIDDTVLLESETPTTFTLNGTDYDQYQVDLTTKTTDQMGNASTTSEVDSDSPTLGLVKAYTPESGNTLLVTSFNGTQDHLAFPPTQIATTAAGNTIPPVLVSVLDDTNTVDANANGSITLTLQSASRLNTSTGTLGGTDTQPIINGVATFNDLTVSADGTYTLTATDSDTQIAPVPSGRFKIGSNTLQLEIRSRGGTANGVKTGNIILYSMTVTPPAHKTIQSQVIVLTFPTGFIVGNNGGGTVSGNTITFNTTQRFINFDLTVPDAKTLGKLGGITKVTVTADDNVTYSDATTDEGTASNSIKLASSYEIDGTVHDVISRVAQLGNVIIRPTLAGVTVQLIDSTGAVVDTGVTRANGKFAVTAKKAGTYKLLFSDSAGMYNSAANDISTLRFYLAQTVTLEPSNTTPIDLGDLYMPKTFLDNSAKVLQSLNNYKTSSFGGLQTYTFPLFQFDTSAAESALASLTGTASNPGTFMNVNALQAGQQPDPWVAGIRMMLALAGVDRRFTDSFRLVDQTAKAASVALSVALVKRVQADVRDYNAANPGQRKWNITPLVNQDATQSSISQGLRVSLFTSLGQVVSSAFDKAVAVLPVDARTKASLATYKAGFISSVFSGLRFGYDFLTGQKILADGLFESAFNLIRIGIDMILLQGLSGAKVRLDIPVSLHVILFAPEVSGALLQLATPNLQVVIDAAVDNRMSYNTNTDTNDVVDSLEFYDDLSHQGATLAQGLVSSLNTFGSVTRGIDGAGFLLGRGSPAAGSLASVIQRFASAADAGANLIIKGGTKALSEVTLPPLLATAGVGFLYQLVRGQYLATLVQTGSASTSSLDTAILPSVVTAPLPTAMPAASFARTAAVAGPADSTAFITDLNQLSTLVKASNTDGIAALYSQFVSDEKALFSNDLVLLENQADALGPQLTPGQKNIVSGYDIAVAYALNQVTFASEQLDAWGSDPTNGVSSLVVSQFRTTIAAVNAAVKRSSLVRALVTGAKVPVTFAIEETSVPSSAAVGSTQTLSFTITNVGSAAASAGNISFITSDGSMILNSAGQLAMDALAPGASATYTWQVQIAAPTNTVGGASFQILAVTAEATATVTDSVAVTP